METGIARPCKARLVWSGPSSGIDATSVVRREMGTGAQVTEKVSLFGDPTPRMKNMIW